MNPKDERIPEIMAPAGAKTFPVRIPTIGKYMLMFKDGDISLINIRNNTKEKVTASDIGRSLVKIYDVNEEKDPEDGLDSSEDLWEHIYDAKFPKKEEVAPVQQPKEKKKESKVASSKPEKLKYEKPEIIEEPKNPVSNTWEGDSENEESHETDISEEKNEEKPESTTKGGIEENEKAEKTDSETADLSLDNPEDDRYEYMDPDQTIEALEEIISDYERVVERMKKREEDYDYVDVTFDLGYAEAVYNAAQELKYMRKLGGSRR